MSWNLLVWKWAPDFDTPVKRKKQKIKMADVTSGFAQSGWHQAIGEYEMDVYISKVEDKYGTNEDTRPFVLERYKNCLVFNYGSLARTEVVPFLGNMAMAMGLNAAEF